MVIDRLEEVRKKEGLSIAAFERTIGYSNKGYHHALNKRQQIKENVIKKAIETFDLDSNWLLFGD